MSKCVPRQKWVKDPTKVQYLTNMYEGALVKRRQTFQLDHSLNLVIRIQESYLDGVYNLGSKHIAYSRTNVVGGL